MDKLRTLLIVAILTAFTMVLLFGFSEAVQGRLDKTTPIKCYQCNSFYDKGCSDFFDNKTYPLIPCKENVTMCRKIIQEAYYDGHWDIRYIRQCAKHGQVGPREGRFCQERSSNFRVKVKVCHCDNKDGCNAATMSSPSTNLIFLLVLAGTALASRAGLLNFVWTGRKR